MINKISSNKILQSAKKSALTTFNEVKEKTIDNATNLFISPTHSKSNSLQALTQCDSFESSNFSVINLNFQTISSIKKEIEGLAKHLKKLFARMIKDFHIKVSTNPAVLSIEEEIKEMGTIVTFENDYNLAKKVLNIFKMIKSRNLELPPQVLLFTPYQENIFSYIVRANKGYEKNSPIFIRKNLAEICENGQHIVPLANKKVQIINVPKIEEIILHELGHYNHLLKCQDEETSFKIFDDFVHKYSHHYIAKHLSFLAITEKTGKEFVAEVFSALLQNKKLPSPIINAYKALNGPSI